ncbi:hypothetical protein K440DRAFT_631403 [Wilcoxina mikolae CBS 423.85]|nr:hypothetical protein K440DRAFT_631403 [Wilcoxina mikolae CBS 423.85]
MHFMSPTIDLLSSLRADLFPGCQCSHAENRGQCNNVRPTLIRSTHVTPAREFR